ncbi:MAG: metallopeptidase family protein [Acidimicrobiales bacterium]
MMLQVSAPRFEQLVADALDQIPDELAELVDNVVVVVEAEPTESGLLGLYEGIPLTERDDYGGLMLPDRVTIYSGPLCRLCVDEAQLVEQVTVTVIHELAHHFGIDDDLLDELGWG